MPSTSAKQHRFMQAVAHSPSFAKKAGVSQSVGKDFSAADKGRTFSKGGTMKIRKFADAGYVDGEDGNQYRDYDPDKTYSGRSYENETGGLAENTPTRAYKPEKRETKDAPAARATASDTYAKAARNKYAEALGYKKTSDNKEISPAAQHIARIKYDKAMKDYGLLSAGYAHASKNKLKQGGSIMESKKMMGKEVAFMKKKGAPASMIKHEKAEMGMKKGSMPMKDGKPAFMKKMMGGGMAYAKGGGIESRGKTKGTVIRMAAGGSVSRRADGIAQRGKTRA